MVGKSSSEVNLETPLSTIQGHDGPVGRAGSCSRHFPEAVKWGTDAAAGEPARMKAFVKAPGPFKCVSPPPASPAPRSQVPTRGVLHPPPGLPPGPAKTETTSGSARPRVSLGLQGPSPAARRAGPPPVPGLDPRRGSGRPGGRLGGARVGFWSAGCGERSPARWGPGVSPPPLKSRVALAPRPARGPAPQTRGRPCPPQGLGPHRRGVIPGQPRRAYSPCSPEEPAILKKPRQAPAATTSLNLMQQRPRKSRPALG